MEIQVTGIQELSNAIEKVCWKEVMQAADKGLQAAGMSIVLDAQENLRRNGTNTTGLLSGSGKVVRSKEPDGGWDAGFMSGEKNYAGAVEFGRRAGKLKYYPKLRQTRRQPPPVDMLEAWAYKKHGVTGAGWALAWHIGAHGTKPQPFFAPAVQKNHTRIMNTLRDAIKQVLNRNV